MNIHTEIRESGGQLQGIILQEGRAATAGRSELFTPFSLTWPATGIQVTVGHGGAVEAMAFPIRESNGEIRIRCRATEAIRRAVEGGARFMSVEFRSIQERTTKAGVREILSAYCDVAALVAQPEYDCNAAEVRSRNRGSLLWL